MENGEISVTQALNTVQSWMNAGEYEKVIQGCKEVLEIEPGNQRALALMKKAEQDRHSKQVNDLSTAATEPEEGASNDVTEPSTENTVQPDPLKELQVEERPEEPQPARPKYDDVPSPLEAARSRRSMPSRRSSLFALIVPAVLVILIGGGVIYGLLSIQRSGIIGSQLGGENNHIEANEERVEVIDSVSKIIEAFYQENGEYPALSQVEEVITQDEQFKKVPVDPRNGEIDKAGNYFGYFYALYDTDEGDRQAYVLSALFEDHKGFGTPWSRGENPKRYEDFRDLETANIEILGKDFEARDIDPSKIEEREKEPRVRVE